MQGCQQRTQLLLSRQANVHHIPHHQTQLKPAIYEALTRKNLPIAQMLFAAGASLSVKNELCNCPFEHAIRMGKRPILECLLQQTPYTSFLSQWPHEREGPIHLAISSGQSDLIPFLIDRGADKEFVAVHGDVAKLGNYRLLHHAANMLDYAAVSSLINSGVDTGQKTKWDQCVNCTSPIRRRIAHRHGLYPRCFLENQKAAVHQASYKMGILLAIDISIQRAGGGNPPYHPPRYNRMKTNKR